MFLLHLVGLDFIYIAYIEDARSNTNKKNISVSAPEKLTSIVSRSYSASHLIMMSAIHTQTSVISQDDLILISFCSVLTLRHRGLLNYTNPNS
jgi:hypothetical protein